MATYEGVPNARVAMEFRAGLLWVTNGDVWVHAQSRGPWVLAMALGSSWAMGPRDRLRHSQLGKFALPSCPIVHPAALHAVRW